MADHDFTQIDVDTVNVFLKRRLRRFVFTWFHYTPEDVTRLKGLTANDIDYLVVGFEICPNTQEKHLQGYIEFDEPQSGAQMIKRLQGSKKIIKPCNIRGAVALKGRLANSRYCKKPESKDPEFPEGYFELLFREKKQGNRSAYTDFAQEMAINPTISTALESNPEMVLKHYAGTMGIIRHLSETQSLNACKESMSDWQPWDWQRKLIMDLSKPADDRKVIWYIDLHGGTGKSKVCDYLHLFHNAELMENGRTADLAHAWQCKPICLFDLSRSTQEHVNYGAIESIKNGRIFSGKYMSGTKWATGNTHVVVFANWEPEFSRLSADRWDIRRINREEHCIRTMIVEQVVDNGLISDEDLEMQQLLDEIARGVDNVDDPVDTDLHK